MMQPMDDKKAMLLKALAARAQGGAPLVDVDLETDEEPEVDNSDLAPESENMEMEEMAASPDATNEGDVMMGQPGEMEVDPEMEQAFMGGMREDELQGPPKSLRERAMQEMMKQRQARA